MNSDHYMQKLQAIRNKYGCTSSTQSTHLHKVPYTSDKPNSEISTYDRKKIIDRTSELSYEPFKNNISVASSYHPHLPTEMKYSRRTQKQIQQIRQNYKPKLMEQPRQHRTYSRDMLERDRDIKPFYRQSEKLNAEDFSPIKRVNDFSGRARENLNDGYWRQREAKLAELSSNNLYESRNSKLEQSKRGKLQEYPMRKGQGLSGRSLMQEGQNRKGSEYTVANIEKIQQRIQDILNNNR